ncbi:MAG: Ppx/GppA phosphatase family protein [Bryobacteraceae bacterium]|jgi:exopolyphosphatase/guanosine-5'-triphosphate,3'-diphosphate pyrophosphatase
MPRYAAVDIGSNSVRMLAAEVDASGQTRVLAEERQVTRLGASVFQYGRISEDAMQLVAQMLANMAQTYRKLDVLAVRAVATSAVRDAGNQGEFLDRASVALGSRVETISGQEEARLIHLGVQARWPHPRKRLLIVDVGGGSMELILSDRGDLSAAWSKPLGAVRLTEVFLKHDPPAPEELRRIHEYIDEKIAPALRRIGARQFDRVIATSATAAAVVCAINRIPRPRRDAADRLRATTAQVRRFFGEVSTQSLAARRKAQGIGPRRAEIIVAGTAVFLRALELFQAPALYYSAAGVREGIVADLFARGAGREPATLSRDQRRTVEEMARRYGVSIPHVRKVAHLAGELFHQLEPLHRLPPSYGRLLQAAGFLHDIGHFVSDSSHHKHSQYLVANSDMPGFTDDERRLISLLCRYHRKSMPAPRHPLFETLAAEDKRGVLLLTPLLRIADSLDRGHEQRVESMEALQRDGAVVVGLRSSADVDLEIWAADRVADHFRQVYNLPVTFVRAALARNAEKRPGR